MIARAACAIALPLIAAGCSLAPETILPAPPVPPSWPSGEAYPAPEGAAASPIPSYRSIFSDVRLQALIEQSLGGNRDLRVAFANVAAARAAAQGARAARLPTIGASAGSGYAERDNGGGGDFSLGAGISAFELDLFGRLANAADAERSRALASEAAARTVRLALIADLAESWTAYGAARDRLAIAEESAANARESVRLTRARLDGGIAPRTDLRRAEQILATAEQEIAAQKSALAQEENRLRLLLGGPLDPALLPSGLDDAAPAIRLPPAGLSSSVLLRRPDVIAAEYRLRAAHADIGAARARLFPTLSLTALVGVASDALTGLFRGSGWNWSAGANASAPIFDFGARRAGVAVSEAERDAALARYEGAIQTAFRDVADALAVQGTIAERLRAATANRAAAEDTARLTEARYRGGIDSFLDNLDAQRSLLAARQGEIAVQTLLVQTRIALFRALGGDGGAGEDSPG
ncbi:efflux transporter outer membrane subunit [Sphingopyxis sp. MWB1]|uniref:efflux transporter outer membrane subunit n=1 Tax=Sphingopyxis sp. MWB1 TaxID=1537715 RepID=UPI00051A2F7D|nr:efflux transporter outer membrane subunit [Sphingopyxis sp. MWB1]